ncbi:DUF4097 family beta strand repeat-containing protein [Streptomyces sp. NPDC005438]|uniref:DUF4097 family beta strand repeat-containing protein n=1 Tax=Streptomyces sp. NPDC005438 TaxID=3156880 RepID=UPI0033A0ECE7
MSTRSQTEWELSAPQTIELTDPVTELDIRLVGGTVSVVGTDDDTARIEVTRINGPEVVLRQEDGVVRLGYRELFEHDLIARLRHHLLGWMDREWDAWGHLVEVTLAVPAATPTRLSVVHADAVVSRLTGTTRVRGVTGGLTLTGTEGAVRVDTVNGDIEVRGGRGSLAVRTVSGRLTAMEIGSLALDTESVTGDTLVDVTEGGAGLTLKSVSGEIVIRLPRESDTAVEANTTSGKLAHTFDELRVSGGCGTRQLTGELGSGGRRLRATTVSGSISLLGRPDDSAEESADEGADADTGSDIGSDTDSESPSTGPSLDKEV